MKKYRIYNKLLLVFVVILGIFGCSTSEDKGSGSVQTVYHSAAAKPQVVVSSKYIPINIAKKQNYSLNASVIPEEESSSALLYSSNNSSVATVTNDGNIQIHKTGIALITVELEKDSSVNNQVIVNAYKGVADSENTVPVVAVAVDTTYIKLQKKGSKQAVFPSVRPYNASNKELVYLSTNPNVATINNKGIIQANSDGNAGIIICSKSNPEIFAFINVDVGSAGSDFTAPAGTAPIDLKNDPMSLIAKYKILSYTINGNAAETADEESNLRVNVNLNELGKGFVKILMYVNLNGKEVRLIQKKNVNNYGSIPDIFTSLGANITGQYTMEFTLDPKNYSELARQGMVNKGDTIVLSIGKMEALAPAGGLGNDIVFNESTVPVEGENTDDDITETPENPDNNKSEEIQVESIMFDINEFSPISLNETIQINASVYPETAVNKTLIWKSSDSSVATVDDGLVTVHKNGSAIITAESSNGIKAEMKIVPVTDIDDFKLDVDNKDFILNVDTQMQLTYTVYPNILNGVDHKAVYSSNNKNIAEVDNSGNIKALSEGETFITVSIGDTERLCFIRVLPEDAASIPVTAVELAEYVGRYSPTFGSFKLEAQVLPAEAMDKRLTYVSSNNSVATVNAAGMVTIKGFGETDITVTSFNNKEAKAVYKLIVETLPTNIVYERFDYGVAIGETSKIIPIYEGDPSNRNTTYTIDNEHIAKVDEKTGAVTGISSGTATLEAVTENGKKAATTIYVYTPVVKGDVSSLQGTYQIVDFNQANGHLDVGTNAYGGVERMIGEMTIEVTGNTVSIKSKIQMDSSKMNTFGGVLGQGIDKARSGQFQYTEYSTAAYNQDGFGTASQTSAKVTHDNDMLKLYQQWNEMGVATVTVNTWIKKKADTIKDLKKDYFHFGYMDINKTQKSNAYANKDKYYPSVNVPEQEPYYTYGRITK